MVLDLKYLLNINDLFFVLHSKGRPSLQVHGTAINASE